MSLWALGVGLATAGPLQSTCGADEQPVLACALAGEPAGQELQVCATPAPTGGWSAVTVRVVDPASPTPTLAVVGQLGERRSELALSRHTRPMVTYWSLDFRSDRTDGAVFEEHHHDESAWGLRRGPRGEEPTERLCRPETVVGSLAPLEAVAP